MSFVPAVSIEQPLGNPVMVTFTDDSVGSDSNITQRRIYIRKADGAYLVPSGTSTDYIEWSWDDSAISLEIMNIDYALYIEVQWLDISNNVLYSYPDTYNFTEYSELFYYQLTENLASNYPIIADQNYYNNKMMLRVEIDSANQAISIGSDISASQACLNRAKYLVDNQSKFF